MIINCSNTNQPCTLPQIGLLLALFTTLLIPATLCWSTKENVSSSSLNFANGNHSNLPTSESTSIKIDTNEDIDLATTENGLTSLESIDSKPVTEAAELTRPHDINSSTEDSSIGNRHVEKHDSSPDFKSTPSPSASSLPITSAEKSSSLPSVVSSSSSSSPSSSPSSSISSLSSTSSPSEVLPSLSTVGLTAPPVKLSTTSNISTQSTFKSTQPSLSNDNFTEMASRRDETHKRKVNGNPTVDELIGSIMKLIGGNVKLSQPPITPRPGLPQGHMGIGPPPGRPILIPYPPHPPPPPSPSGPGLGQQGSGNNPSRINNRGPPKVPYIGSPNGGSPFPPNILIGPGQSSGLPIPIPTNFNHQQSQPHPMIPQQNPRPPEHIPSGRPVQPQQPNRAPEESEAKPNEIYYNNRKQVIVNEANDLNSIGFGSESNKQQHQQQPQQPNQRFKGSVLVQSESVNSASFEDPSNRQKLPPTVLESSQPISTTSILTNQTISLESSMTQTHSVNAAVNVTPSLESSSSSSSSSISSIVSSSSSGASVPSGPVTAWLPFFVQPSVTSSKVTWSDEPPPIITKPEEPSVFDITVKHKIGPNSARVQEIPKIVPTRPIESSVAISMTNTVQSSSSSTTPPLQSVPNSESTLNPSSMSTDDKNIDLTISPSSTPTEVTRNVEPGRPSSNSTRILFPSRPVTSDPEPDIVYGRPANKDHGAGGNRGTASHKPTQHLGYPPSAKPNNPYNRIPVTTKELTRPLIPTSVTKTVSSSTAMLGRPIVIPVEVDEVRPNIGSRGGSGGGNVDSQGVPDVLTEPGQGSVFIDGKPTYFKIRPGPPKPAGPTLQVGSGVTINIDSPPGSAGGKPLPPSSQSQIPVSGLPSNPSTISGTGSRSPGPISSSTGSSSSSSSVVRRPPFRPRPNTPLVRIDTCIVGDDSTCGANLNEHCKTEIGISSCQCKPGYGRITARGMCTPVASLGVFLRLDKLGEAKVVFNRKLMDPDTEEFQYLEYEALQALNSLFTTSRLGKVFKGARVNKFYSMGGKTVANATVELDRTNVTRSATIKRIVQQELVRVIATNNNRLGDSQLYVDASLHAIPKVDDINECANNELNDCSKFAVCTNEFGSYRCACKPGYEDKFSGDPVKSGRQCATCSPAYCSNRGDCIIVNGEKECRCRGNFIGSRCDIDGEVLGVALGGSVAALIIIIITFLCLYMWNQRWKREQQKMEAMSSGSGQTFSYVNKTQAAANYRCGLDDRARWATMAQTLPVNPNYNYYVNPEQLMATSQQHVYATPGRAQTPEALINDEACTVDSRHYPRPIRPKSRAFLAQGPYSTMTFYSGN